MYYNPEFRNDATPDLTTSGSSVLLVWQWEQLKFVIIIILKHFQITPFIYLNYLYSAFLVQAYQDDFQDIG